MMMSRILRHRSFREGEPHVPLGYQDENASCRSSGNADKINPSTFFRKSCLMLALSLRYSSFKSKKK